MVTYDVDGAIVTNCVVEFIGTSFPSSGTTITNAGTGGATYNGTAAYTAFSEYQVAPSGAQAWALSQAAIDYISFPYGTAINNPTYITCEIAFACNQLSGGALISRRTSGSVAGFIVQTNSDGSISVTRGKSTSAYRKYNSPASELALGHNYFLQITWDCSGYTNTPIVMLSTDGGTPASLTMTYAGTGTTNSWVSDSTTNTLIGALTTSSSTSADEIFLYRLHTVILSAGDLTTNFNASVWRLAASSSKTFTQGTPPNVAVATVAPTIGLAVAPASINVGVAIVMPTISVSSNIVLGTPKNVAVATVAPAIGLAITQGMPPNVAAATVAPTIGVGVTQGTPPDVAVAVIMPIVTTAPLGAVFTQTVVPNVAVALVMPTISTTDVDGAIVTNCQIEFIGDSFPNVGTTLTNRGRGGAAYNAAATTNEYSTLPSSVQAWTTPNGQTCLIPHGSAVDNLTYLTVEFLFEAQSNPNGYPAHIYKGNDSTPCWEIGYKAATSQFYVFRYASDGSTYRYYLTPTCSVTAGMCYLVQVTWDCSSFTSTPVIKVNNVAQTPITNSSNGIPSAWFDDSGQSIGIGSSNTGAGAGISNDIWAVLRIHDAVLADSDLQTNYNASAWRLASGASFTQTVVPDVAIATVAPTISLGIAQGTPPNVAVALLSPTIGLAISPAVQNVAVATVSPTIGIGVTQGTPPNVAVAIVSPTISASSNIVQGTPPNVAVALISPTISLGLSPASIDVAVALVSPTVGIGVTQGTPPNVAVAIVAPTISTSSNIVLTSVPDVAVATQPTSVGIGLTQTTPPDVAVALVSPTVGIGITQPIVPDISVSVIAPSISTSSNIVQTLVPDVTAAIVSPTVGIGIAQPTIPSVAVAHVSPTIGIAVSPTPPDVSVDVIMPVITIAEAGGWTQVTSPDVAVDILQPTIGIAITPSAPGVSATVVRPTVGIGFSQTTVPDVAVAVIMPVITIASSGSWTQTVVPNVLVDVLKPSVGIAITPSVPDVSATVSRPTIGLGITQTAPPNVSVAILMPVVTTETFNKYWTQVFVPDVTAQIVRPLVGIAIQPDSHDVAVDITQPTIDVGIEPAAPDVAVTIIKPIVTVREFNPGSIVRLEGSSGTDMDLVGSDSAAALIGSEDYDAELAGSVGDVSLDGSSLDSVDLEGAR